MAGEIRCSQPWACSRGKLDAWAVVVVFSEAYGRLIGARGLIVYAKAEVDVGAVGLIRLTGDRAHHLGEAPVHHEHLAEAPDHDVVGLEIPVDHPPGVGVGNRLADGVEHVDEAA